MKSLIILIFTVAFICIEAENNCFDKTEACHSTDYQSYVNCVRRRHKRSESCGNSCNSGNCIDTCNNCDCNSCNYNNCDNSCNSCCSSCCSNYIPCRTNHCCHRTCQAQCDSSRCRSSCRKNCYETVRTQPEQSIANSQSTDLNSSSINSIRHNVTTIIHLNNVINNTNVIDVPININNTNDQNITLYTADSSGPNASGQQCCIVIGPRQCVSQPTVRCFHYRSKQCGDYCTANIVHREEKQICESYYPGATLNCRQQIYYIPQPTPRCVYQSVWPYVSCGIQRLNVGCEGCYSHYTDQTSINYLQCPLQCYDDGFHVGPIYRQGPVYRPTYSHAPCYGCFGYPNQVPYIPSYDQLPLDYSNNIYSIPDLEINLNNTNGSNGLIFDNSTNVPESQIVIRQVPVDVELDKEVEPDSSGLAKLRIKKSKKTNKSSSDSNATVEQ